MVSTKQISDQSTKWRQFCVDVVSENSAKLKCLSIETGLTDRFVQFLHRHGLETLLIDLLEQQKKIDLLPDFIINKLREVRRDACIKEIYRKQHLVKLLEILTKNEIKCLILKGTALAYTIYERPYLRPRLDTDIFINIDDKQKLDQLLIDNGFSKSSTISGEFVSHQNTYKQNQNGISHAYDIHWKISNRNAYANRFNFDQLYANRVKLSKLSDLAFGLNNVDAFLHGTVHYFGHRSDERDRLIWLYDLHHLCNQFSHQQWELLLQASKRKQFDPLIKQILEVCETIFSIRVPNYVLNELKNSQTNLSDIENKRLNAENWSRIDQFKSDWAALSFKQRCQLIKENLLPPSEFILKQNNSSTKLLLPYFYLKRIISGGFKILNNNKN